jgi:hypothetical protein
MQLSIPNRIEIPPADGYRLGGPYPFLVGELGLAVGVAQGNKKDTRQLLTCALKINLNFSPRYFQPVASNAYTSAYTSATITSMCFCCRLDFNTLVTTKLVLGAKSISSSPP